ncbi:MAG: tetratricopeptide repeat protein, partial [Candidatus Eisenbacteria bacterium]|nr:tetratricopeptide repeat protein [Candidatus Eisenbacteria bacterium]
RTGGRPARGTGKRAARERTTGGSRAGRPWGRATTGLAVAAGALLGLASLGKPNILLFVPAAAVWLFVKLGRGADPGDASGSGRLRTRAVAPLALFAAAGLVILPATIHNYRTEGDLIPVSSNAGINLYIGNHPGAPGTFTVPPDMRFDLRVASERAAERATGRDLSAGEVSDYWTGLALRFAQQRPGMWLRQMGRKFALFWNHYEIPNHYDLNFVADFAPILRNPLGAFAVVAPLGLAGLVFAVRRKRRVGLLVLFGITFMCSVLPFFVTGRYRLPVVLALLPGAGYAVHAAVRYARTREWRRLLAIGTLTAALAVLVNVDIIEFSSAQMHNTLGAIYGRQGDLPAAARQFGAAIEENPDDLSARRNLGRALLELGRYGEAAREYREALRRHPAYHEARLELGMAQAARDSIAAAVRTWSNLLAMRPPEQIASAARHLIDQSAVEPNEEER